MTTHVGEEERWKLMKLPKKVRETEKEKKETGGIPRESEREKEKVDVINK
jgi:hypothetical protein